MQDLRAFKDLGRSAVTHSVLSVNYQDIKGKDGIGVAFFWRY